jgi:hypothetical protein
MRLLEKNRMEKLDFDRVCTYINQYTTIITTLHGADLAPKNLTLFSKQNPKVTAMILNLRPGTAHL